MCVQTFRPELAVEGFDEAIISRFTWPREVERDVICIGPQVKITGDEFAGVLDNPILGIFVTVFWRRSMVV